MSFWDSLKLLYLKSKLGRTKEVRLQLWECRFRLKIDPFITQKHQIHPKSFIVYSLKQKKISNSWGKMRFQWFNQWLELCFYVPWWRSSLALEGSYNYVLGFLCLTWRNNYVPPWCSCSLFFPPFSEAANLAFKLWSFTERSQRKTSPLMTPQTPSFTIQTAACQQKNIH